jgi:hypothetical protein
MEKSFVGSQYYACEKTVFVAAAFLTGQCWRTTWGY